jgi:hypothetical protein
VYQNPFLNYGDFELPIILRGTYLSILGTENESIPEPIMVEKPISYTEKDKLKMRCGQMKNKANVLAGLRQDIQFLRDRKQIGYAILLFLGDSGDRISVCFHAANTVFGVSELGGHERRTATYHQLVNGCMYSDPAFYATRTWDSLTSIFL